MAKNISTNEPRFSLNGSHLPHPIAESTCLNFNGTNIHLPWINAALSPSQRSSSIGCLAQVGKSSTLQRMPTLANGSKIDARTFTDAQSNGLAGRIVKYHENSSKLNRSQSMNTLYRKPGQFPVVHLKKHEIPLKANKQKLSMTRIAPPEKSLFYGNTLSGLLRSNSIVGVQKSDEELSHENRPIMHPPPTEDDSVPTRSVLDVLKEISRKRINSDEEDGRVEASLKKYCNREGQEVLDTAYYQRALNGHNSSPCLSQITQKRQREPLSTPPRPVISPSNQLQSAQKSPEQLAKSRRISNYNNDISSSLSSSLIYTKKRKLYDTPSKRTSPVAEEAQRNKMQRQQQMQQRLGFNMPISSTPHILEQAGVSAHDRPSATQSMLTLPVSNGGVTHTLSMPTYLQHQQKINEQTVNNSKPRLTLFNKNYEDCEETSNADAITNDHEDLDKDDDAYAGVQFVKPKKGTLLTGSKHPLIQRTQKSKLALMLSGLRGELYQGDDELDTSTKPTNQINQFTMPENTPKTVEVATTAITTAKPSPECNKINLPTTFTPPTTSSSSIIGINALKNVTSPKPILPATMPLTGFSFATTTTTTTTTAQTTGITTTPTTVASTTNPKTSPLVGIKLTPALTTAAAPAAATTLSAMIRTTAANNQSLPVLGGFQFGVNTAAPATLQMGSGAFNFDGSNLNTTTTTTTTTTASPTSLTTKTAAHTSSIQQSTFNFSTPQMPTTTTTTTTAASANGEFSFGMTTTAPVTTVGSTTASQPTFAFGNNNNNTPAFGFNAIATTKTTNTITPYATFSFDANTAPSTTITTKPNESANSFSFGGNSNKNALPTTTATTTNIPSNNPPAFTFNATKPIAAATPFPNNSNNNMGNSGFSFATANNTNTGNTGFNFGGNTTSNATSTIPIFGGNSNKTTTAFAFNTATTTNTNTNTTGQSTATGLFFDGVATTTAAASTNLFGNQPISSSASSNTTNLFASAAVANPTTTATVSPFPTFTKPVASNTFTFGNTTGGLTPATNQPTSLFGVNNNNNNNSNTSIASKTTNLFGVNNTNNTNNNTNSVTQPANIFGAGHTNNNNNNSSSNNTTSATQSSNIFGAGNNNNINNAANTTSQSSNLFGVSNNNSNNANNATNSAPQSSNLFGVSNNNINNATNAASQSTNLFGASNNNNNNTTNTTAEKSNFNFGSTNNNNNAPAFGDNNTNNNSAFGSKPFAFGSNNSSSNTTTFGNIANNSVPTFGSAVGVQNSNPPVTTAQSNSTPFSFGGNSAATDKPFTFGIKPNNNVFGSVAASTTQAQPTAAVPAFSFTGNNAATALGAPPNMNNIFAPAQSSGNEGRPIRRATRRLHKP